MSRLTIDITPEQHKRLKALAALEGKSIKAYSLERLFPAKDGALSDEDQAWEEFKAFIGKRVDEAMEGKFSSRSILDIANDRLRKAQARQ